jgi:hypothetical protein
LALAVLIWAGAGVRADLGKDRLPLETLVPPETLLLISFPDIGKAKEDWKQTGLYKIWKDPEVQHALDVLLGNVESYRKEFEESFKKETGVAFEDALEVFSGQFSIALVSFPQDPSDKPPAAALALDFGERKAEMEKLLATGLGFLKEQQRDWKAGSWESEGLKVSTLGRDPITLHYVLAGPTLLVATEKGLMEGMLHRARDAKIPSLAGSEDYKKAVTEVAGKEKSSFLMYANVPAWVSFVENMAGGSERDREEVGKVLDATGARTLKAAALAVTFAEGGVRDKMYLHAPGERKGILRILSPGRTRMPTLPMVPADAVSFAAIQLNLTSAWDQAMAILKQVNEDAWREVSEEIAKFEKEAGVFLRSDFLASMGNEVSSWGAYPEGGGVLPYSVTAIALKDPVIFESSLAQLYGAAGMKRKEMEWMGRKIRYFVAAMPEEEEGMPGRPRRGGGMGLIPGFGMAEMLMMNLTSFSAYFIEGGTLYTSNLVQTLKDVLRKREDKEKAHLQDSPEFKKLLAALPPEPGMVFYMDLKRTFSMIYNTLLALAPFGEVLLRRGLNVPFETAALPTAEAVTQHLAPSITGVNDRPEGILMSSHSPNGVTTASFIGVGALAMATAVVVPGLMRSRIGSNEASAIGSLKAICVGQEQFKSACAVDLNSNGVGEYGFLQELAGTSPCRTPGGLKGQMFQASPYIPRILGTTDAQGRSAKAGYYFKVFLPGKTEAHSSEGGVPAGDPELAAKQEGTWCVYAWPQSQGRSGVRTFFIDARGQPYATSGGRMQYSGDNGPAANAAFAPDGPNPKNLEGPLAERKPGSDGNFWFPTG